MDLLQKPQKRIDVWTSHWENPSFSSAHPRQSRSICHGGTPVITIGFSTKSWSSMTTGWFGGTPMTSGTSITGKMGRNCFRTILVGLTIYRYICIYIYYSKSIHGHSHKKSSAKFLTILEVFGAPFHFVLKGFSCWKWEIPESKWRIQ